MQGRVVFGALVISMGTVILAVILGLRHLAGTLGGPDTSNTLVLVAIYVVLVIVASFVSFTRFLIRGDESAETSGNQPQS